MGFSLLWGSFYQAVKQNLQGNLSITYALMIIYFCLQLYNKTLAILGKLRNRIPYNIAVWTAAAATWKNIDICLRGTQIDSKHRYFPIIEDREA